MKDFRQKVFVITGAASGIGRELARQLAERGAVLALNDRDEAGLTTLWEELPAAARGITEAFDVGDRSRVEGFAVRVRKSLGRVDGVINNAGFSLQPRPVVSAKIEDFERVLRVNLWGVIYGSLAFLPHLRERPGSILVNISSVFGLFGFPGQAPYNVSKFAVRRFTETLRVEMRGSGLHVACVHPGGILTNIHHNAEFTEEEERARFIRQFERNAPTTAAGAARVIIRGIERRRPRILIGRDARFIDKVARLLPATYERVLARWWKLAEGGEAAGANK